MAAKPTLLRFRSGPDGAAVDAELLRQCGDADAVGTGCSHSVHFLLRQPCSSASPWLRRRCDEWVVGLTHGLDGGPRRLIPHGNEPLDPLSPVSAMVNGVHPKCLTGTAQSVARARPDAVLPCSCDGERGETDLERAPDPAQSEAQRCRPVSERVRTASSGNTMNARICTSHWPPKTRCSQPRQPGILLASHSAPSVIATITATSMTARTRTRDEPGAGRPAAALRPEVIMLAGARPRGASVIARRPKRCQLLGQRFRHLHGQRVSGVRPDLGCHVRDEFCLRQ